MKFSVPKIENKDTAVAAAKETVKNIPIVLATSIPVVGSVVTLVKDTYDGVKLKEFQDEFDNLKKTVIMNSEAILDEAHVVKTIEGTISSEQYVIKTIKGIEIFFADYIETNDYDFIEDLKAALEDLNDECKIHGTYGCVYDEYVLTEESLQILFDDIYDKEYADEYIEGLNSAISSDWHEVSPIHKVKYY